MELSDDELERRMRRALFLSGGEKRGETFTDEERRIADKLLGRAESHRLQSRRDNSRPFRPRKPVVVAEYYEVPGRFPTHSGWKIDVRENGIIRNSKGGLSREQCLRLIAGLSRKGVQIKEIVTEAMKLDARAPSVPIPDTRRKTFEQRFGDFRGVID